MLNVINLTLSFTSLGNINNLIGCCWFYMKQIQREIDIDLLYFLLNCFFGRRYLTPYSYNTALEIPILQSIYQSLRLFALVNAL